MKPGIAKLCFVIQILVLPSISIILHQSVQAAPLPRTINYQGYLKDVTGVSVTTATNVTFSLYSTNPSRSNPVWRETRGIMPVNDSTRPLATILQAITTRKVQ